MEIFIGTLILYGFYILYIMLKKILFKNDSEILISNESKRTTPIENYYSKSNNSNNSFENKQSSKSTPRTAAAWYGENQ